jgi:hypothetical protein
MRLTILIRRLPEKSIMLMLADGAGEPPVADGMMLLDEATGETPLDSGLILMDVYDYRVGVAWVGGGRII